VAYVVDPLSGVTEQWILDHVVPNLTKKVTPEVAKVLGRAVLFRVFDSSGEVAFPPHRREQILEAYSDLGYRNQLVEGTNPIMRKPLVVSGHDSEVVMDLMDTEDNHQDARRSLALRQQEVRMLATQVLHLRHELMDARAEAERQLAVMKRQLGRMSNNVSRLTNRPAIVRRGGTVTGQGTLVAVPTVEANHASIFGVGGGSDDMDVDEPAVVPVVLETRLMKCPKTLHDLWKEYEFGFHGYKPAKDWTATERGRDKFKYYRRNVVWKKICELVRGGYTAERACDKIYSVYGHSSTVTAIIKQLVKDKGRHPELRVGHL
jgi:hypothetical protein